MPDRSKEISLQKANHIPYTTYLNRISHTKLYSQQLHFTNRFCCAAFQQLSSICTSKTSQQLGLTIFDSFVKLTRIHFDSCQVALEHLLVLHFHYWSRCPFRCGSNFMTALFYSFLSPRSRINYFHVDKSQTIVKIEVIMKPMSIVLWAMCCGVQKCFEL